MPLNVRLAGAEREKAETWWKALDSGQRGDLGDAFVLGTFDWRDWGFSSKPSGVFLNHVDLPPRAVGDGGRRMIGRDGIQRVPVKRRARVVHVETPLGIVNIYLGLRDRLGRRVERVEMIPTSTEATRTSDERKVRALRDGRFVETLVRRRSSR